jgi:hypothetical protein
MDPALIVIELILGIKKERKGRILKALVIGSLCLLYPECQTKEILLINNHWVG